MKIPVKILIIDLLLFLICIPGIIQIINKADTSLPLNDSGNSLILTTDSGLFRKFDMLVAFDGHPVNNIHHLEFLTDTKNPSDTVVIKVSRDAVLLNIPAVLHSYYDIAYVTAVIFIGCSFFVIGLIVLLRGTDRTASKIFHWAAVSTALILFCTWGNIYVLPFKLGYLVRYFFHVGYTLAPAMFIHFALVFPVNRAADRKPLIYFIYTASILLFIFLSLTFSAAADNINYYNIRLYLTATNFLRLFVVSGVLLSIIIFSRSYFLAQSLSEKKKLKWILFGFIAGPLTYILTWVIPQSMNFTLIPEIAAIFIMLSVPISFSIAILKYHLLDIDIVINRSIVYFISIAVLVVVYFALLYLVSDLMSDSDEKLIPLIVVVTAAFLFQPVKSRVQKFVDEKFFRVQYDFRNAVKKFFTDLKQSNDFNSLASIVVNETDKLIPLRQCGVVFYDDTNKFITHFFHNGFHSLEQEGALYKLQQLFQNIPEPAGYLKRMENGVEICAEPKELFELFALEIIIPLINNEQKISGYLLIGHKKSGARFAIEDVELLKMIGLRTTLEISRIQLNQKLIYEQLQSEKLQELDKLKSFFISSTAHELKTPITSIRLFSEMLESRTPREYNEYFDTIKGECDRLTRLIDNLLDISRIERKEKTYNLNPVELISIIRKSLLLMEYQFKIEQCRVSFSPCGIDLMIAADEDAVISALINIYNNALKYSRDPRKLLIKIEKKDNNALISVTDNGIGINKEDINKILQPYYRSTLVQNRDFIGTGIGLALVKHIVEGHEGKIYINSIPDQGSTFTLEFPLLEKETIKNEERITS